MKKVLYIDMDGVIADFDKGVKKHCPDLHTHQHTQSNFDKVNDICEANTDIFHNLEPIEGAIEAVHALLDNDRYDIYFLSTPMWNVPESFTGKRIWLGKYFQEKVEKRLILTHRKDLAIGHYLIDDTTRNGAGEFKGMHIHFGTEKFPDWKSVLEFLLSPEKKSRCCGRCDGVNDICVADMVCEEHKVTGCEICYGD